MEELLNERYSTSEMPQMWGKLFRTAQPLPELRDAPRVTERPDTVADTEHGKRYCGL